MGLTEWLIIGATGLMVRSAMKKTAEEREREEAKLEEYREQQKKTESEYSRQRTVEQERKKTPCYFDDGLSADDFSDIAHAVQEQIKRVRSISISGAVVYGTVESQTGLSDWDFRVDFNNWGHVTGTYWKWTENYDSAIPKHFGDLMSSAIHQCLRERNISLDDFSDAVDENTDIGTDVGLNFNNSRIIKKLFSKGNHITINYSLNELLGEHVYPIVSLLKANGFLRIKCSPIKDVTEKSPHYIYEVERVSIGGTSNFSKGQMFEDDVEVNIFYHDKKEIPFPFSESDFKRKNYIEVGDRIQKLGFTEIYERPIRDLTTGWLVKDGSVEQILVDGKEDEPVKKNASYLYDTKLVITYHTFEKK